MQVDSIGLFKKNLDQIVSKYLPELPSNILSKIFDEISSRFLRAQYTKKTE